MEMKTRRLTIEVDETAGRPGNDPIIGQLTDEYGTIVRFSGWLGLASGLERLLDPEHEAQPRQTVAARCSASTVRHSPPHEEPRHSDQTP